MSHWNYRITRRTIEGEYIDYAYEIRELYYDDDGKATSWSEDPIAPSGDSRQECLKDLALMSRASNHAVFDLETKTFLPEDTVTHERVNRATLVTVVTQALWEELPEIGDTLRRRADHIAEVAVDAILRATGRQGPEGDAATQP